jgi:cytochrome c biogenesis protein CcdA
MDTIIYSISLSLFDSLSTAQQIVIFTLMLTTLKPIRNSLSFLAGLIGAYFACGIGGYLVLDRLLIFINKYFPSTADLSNQAYYQTELLTGIVMAVIGIVYFRKMRYAQQRKGRAENILLEKLKSMNMVIAFILGAIISITSFPFSIPYLVALGKYATLHLDMPAVTRNILIYNIGYALPMILVLAIYLIARRNIDDIHDTLHEKAHILNVHLTTWALAGIGIFSIIDAGSFFLFGQALVKGRYF